MQDAEKPAVTVLMPVFNAEKFLGEAIESILNQTLRNFEFLIIDDGSSDKSLEIIESYTDPRIRLIRNQRNLGISGVLNQGIENSSAELIARMDADDISYPERLAKQFAYFAENPQCALLSTWAREITEENEPVCLNRWKSEHYYYNLIFHCWIYHPTVMYRRRAVVDVGKYPLSVCEDYELWQRIARRYEIGNLEEALLDYRLTNVSLTRGTNKEHAETVQSNIVRSNIEYFTDGALAISPAELEFLQNNCDLLLEENDIPAIAHCFRKLELINKCILKKENVNLDREATRTAANEKKRLLIESIRHKLPKAKLVRLLALLGEWGIIADLSARYFRKALFR